MNPQAFSRVFVTESGCHEYTGYKSYLGYSIIRHGKKAWPGHRLRWTMERGEIPEGVDVMHKCDNRACINIDHLALGTHHENMLDMARKNRHKIKLEIEDVRAIRAAVAAGETHQSVANRHGVSQSMVTQIANRKRRGAID